MVSSGRGKRCVGGVSGEVASWVCWDVVVVVVVRPMFSNVAAEPLRERVLGGVSLVK